MNKSYFLLIFVFLIIIYFLAKKMKRGHTYLSQNFSLEELTRSDYAITHKIDNNPSNKEIKNLTDLCENVLQPIRDFLGKPLTISSGYRSKVLNRAIGGANGSEHELGLAADIPESSATFKEIEYAVNMLDLPVGQLIDEISVDKNGKKSRWTHISYGTKGEVLTMRQNQETGYKKVYELVRNLS